VGEKNMAHQRSGSQKSATIFGSELQKKKKIVDGDQLLLFGKVHPTKGTSWPKTS